jgi:hypothetical protein
MSEGVSECEGRKAISLVAVRSCPLSATYPPFSGLFAAQVVVSTVLPSPAGGA